MPRSATAKEPKAKQQHIEGFQPKEIKEVREACELLKEIVDERLEVQGREEKQQQETLRVMERNKVNEYRVGNYVFSIHEGKRKVKRVKVTDKDETADQVAKDEKSEQDRKKAAGGDTD